MIIRKTLIAALASATAFAFSPLPELRAAPFTGSSSQPMSGELVQSVQAKKKKKGVKKATKRKAGKRKTARRGAGKSCGTYMYRKGGKCLDARNKK